MRCDRALIIHTMAMHALVLLCLLLIGCAGPATQRLEQADAAYRRGDYDAAYRLASSAAGSATGSERDLANYLAGIAARQRGELRPAEHYLRQASRSRDRDLAADALASLGLVHHRMGQYDEAAEELTRAARQLSGDQRAQAYFHAAIAQQKLSRWSQARTSLILARGATTDAELRRQIDEQLATTGYTLQVGAFANPANARRLAERMAGSVAGEGLGAVRLVTSTDSRGRSLTLVQVGRFASFDAAQQARRRLDPGLAIVVPLSRR